MNLNLTKMNFRVKKLSILIGIILATVGCEKMNDKHKTWLENGEIVYVGKVDSIKAFSGDERILFHYWISDPRVKTLQVSWSLGSNILEIPVPAHLPAEPFELYIGSNEKKIVEGIHTFNWVTWDHHGNKSIVFETTANVYGQRYQKRLSNRPVIIANAVGTDVTVTWGGKLDDDEIEVILNYTTTSDESIDLRYTGDELTSTVLPDVKLTAPIMYQTLYIPEPTAIDTFSVEFQKIDVQTRVNVVLNKPVTHSDANAANQTGQMAIDGDRTNNASRWVSDDTHREHWIDIDLQEYFTISAFAIWRDLQTASQRMPQFCIQAWIEGDWVTVFCEVNNEMAEYYSEFESVTTNRVRLYIPPYTNNRVRLFELEVYSIIKY